jgi:hypothetical protein
MADLVDKQIDALRRLAALPAMQAEGFMDVAVPAMQGLLNRLDFQAAEVSRLRAIIRDHQPLLEGTIATTQVRLRDKPDDSGQVALEMWQALLLRARAALAGEQGTQEKE